MAVKSEKDLPPNARALWLKALSAMELKNYGYAVSLLQSVLKETPEFLDGRQILRRAAIGATKGKRSFFSGLSKGGFGGMKSGGLIKKDPLAAIEAAEKALESDPSSTAANRMLYEAALAAEMPETAAFALETLHEAHPKDTKLLHELAKHYYHFDEPKKSIETYGKILEINPMDIAAVKGSKDASARLSMVSGGWETAQDYRDLIKDKEQAVSLEQKGRVIRSDEMIDNQLAELGALYAQDQNNIELVRKIAGLYEQKGDLENAISYYQWGAELSKGSDPGLSRKVSDLAQRSLEVRATAIEHWLAENGENAEGAAEQISLLADLRKEIATAKVGDARKRVERNPTDLQLRFELAEHLFHAGNYTDAIPELQKARQNPNARIKAINLLGQCMVQKGMFDLAANQFREAAEEIPQMDALKKELLYNLGLTYDKMGNKEGYIGCMKKIYEVDFSYRDVSERVEKSYSSA